MPRRSCKREGQASVIDAVKWARRVSSRGCVRAGEHQRFGSASPPVQTVGRFGGHEGVRKCQKTTRSSQNCARTRQGLRSSSCADGKIPAVIYGHGTEPVHVALPGHQVGGLIIRRANALLDLQIGDKEQLYARQGRAA